MMIKIIKKYKNSYISIYTTNALRTTTIFL